MRGQRRHSNPHHEHPPETHLAILELHGQGKTPTEISKELSLPRSSVQYTIDHELDFRNRGGETTHQHRTRMLETMKIAVADEIIPPSNPQSQEQQKEQQQRKQRQQKQPEPIEKDPNDPHNWDRDERHVRRMARMGRFGPSKPETQSE